MTIERQFARRLEPSRWGRLWVGKWWDPMLEMEYLLFIFRNRDRIHEAGL